MNDDQLLDEIRDRLRTQVRVLEFRPSDTRVSAGIDVVVPVNGNTSTTIAMNIHELDAWAEQMKAEARRLRRLIWRPHYIGGTIHVALIDRTANGDVAVEVAPTRYGSVKRAQDDCVVRNRARREEMGR